MATSVSVLVPTYNRADYLLETLDSILSQTRKPNEIIVVEDGSVDNTREVIAPYSKYVQYHVIENGGPPRARNVATSLATSEYFAFCDSDDLWRTDKLEQQMELHERDPRVRYSFTNFQLVLDGVWSEKTEFDHAPDQSIAPYFPAGRGPLVVETSLYDQILDFQPIRPSTVVISAEFFHELGGYDEQWARTTSEDVEFALRSVQHTPIGVIREPVVGMRVHGGNFSTSAFKNLQGEIDILEHAFGHHTISDATRALLAKHIESRRIRACYYAFRTGEFGRVVALVRDVPSSSLDFKTRMKLWISKMPAPVARKAQQLMLKE